MPSLAGAPTPNGAAGVEKENDSSASCALPGSFSADFSGNGHPDGNGMVKGSVSGRASLERIGTGVLDGPEFADASDAATGTCNSTSTSSDCSMAASASGIEESREVNNARHPASLKGGDDEDEVNPAAADGDSPIGSNPVAATATATPVKAVGHSNLRAEALQGDGEVLADGSNSSLNTPGALAGAGHGEPRVERSVGAGAGARNATGSIAARFKAARAVFSPPKPSGGIKSAALRTAGRKSGEIGVTQTF